MRVKNWNLMQNAAALGCIIATYNMTTCVFHGLDTSKTEPAALKRKSYEHLSHYVYGG